MDILELYDISIEDAVPDGRIFEASDESNKPTTSIINNFVNKEKYVKSRFVVDTKDTFYDGGIIGHLISANDPEEFLCDLSRLDKSRQPSQDTDDYQPIKFSKFCDHNWLVSFVFMVQFYPIILRYQVSKPIINILNLGNGNNGFIAGIHYFIYNFGNRVRWLGVDKKNNTNHKCYRKLDRYLTSKNEDIDQSIIDDDVTNLKEILDVVETKLDPINILYNNVPVVNFKTLILLVRYDLNENGFLLTKIPEPEYWDTQYLLLVSLIFTKTQIFRFPICKNGKVYFQYYLIGHEKKKIMYSIYRKLNILYHDTLKFTPDIMQSDTVKNWHLNIEKVRRKYIDIISNPGDCLHEYIYRVSKYI